MSEDKTEEVINRFGSEAVIFENEKHGLFVFTKPKRASWQRFQKGVTKDVGEAFDQLCRDCLAYPEKAEGGGDHAKLHSLMEDYPGCPVEIGDKLAQSARGGEASAAGKR
jgi:hypothetical protein